MISNHDSIKPPNKKKQKQKPWNHIANIIIRLTAALLCNKLNLYEIYLAMSVTKDKGQRFLIKWKTHSIEIKSI